jgi:hypothetical protein
VATETPYAQPDPSTTSLVRLVAGRWQEIVNNASWCDSCGATWGECAANRGRDPWAPPWFGCCVPPEGGRCTHRVNADCVRTLVKQIESGEIRPDGRSAAPYWLSISRATPPCWGWGGYLDQGSVWQSTVGRLPVPIAVMAPQARFSAARWLERHAAQVVEICARSELTRFAETGYPKHYPVGCDKHPSDVVADLEREHEARATDPVAWMRTTELSRALLADLPGDAEGPVPAVDPVWHHESCRTRGGGSAPCDCPAMIADLDPGLFLGDAAAVAGRVQVVAARRQAIVTSAECVNCATTRGECIALSHPTRLDAPFPTGCCRQCSHVGDPEALAILMAEICTGGVRPVEQVPATVKPLAGRWNTYLDQGEVWQPATGRAVPIAVMDAAQRRDAVGQLEHAAERVADGYTRADLVDWVTSAPTNYPLGPGQIDPMDATAALDQAHQARVADPVVWIRTTALYQALIAVQSMTDTKAVIGCYGHPRGQHCPGHPLPAEWSTTFETRS